MFLIRLAVIIAQSWYSVEHEDVFGTVLTGDAPTTSEWSTILLPTKMSFILEVWQYKKISLAWHFSNAETCDDD